MKGKLLRIGEVVAENLDISLAEGIEGGRVYWRGTFRLRSEVEIDADQIYHLILANGREGDAVLFAHFDTLEGGFIRVHFEGDTELVKSR